MCATLWVGGAYDKAMAWVLLRELCLISVAFQDPSDWIDPLATMLAAGFLARRIPTGRAPPFDQWKPDAVMALLAKLLIQAGVPGVKFMSRHLNHVGVLDGRHEILSAQAYCLSIGGTLYTLDGVVSRKELRRRLVESIEQHGAMTNPSSTEKVFTNSAAWGDLFDLSIDKPIAAPMARLVSDQISARQAQLLGRATADATRRGAKRRL